MQHAHWAWYAKKGKERSLENKNDKNFVNESYLSTQTSPIVKTYTTTAREPSIYPNVPLSPNIFDCFYLLIYLSLYLLSYFYFWTFIRLLVSGRLPIGTRAISCFSWWPKYNIKSVSMESLSKYVIHWKVILSLVFEYHSNKYYFLNI